MKKLFYNIIITFFIIWINLTEGTEWLINKIKSIF